MIERHFAKYGAESKFLSLLELGRPWNGSISGIIALLGCFLVSKEPLSLFDAIRIFLSFLFLWMGGAIINDLQDINIDKINMPFRPLQSGRVTLSEARTFSFLLYVGGLLLALSLGFNFFALFLLFFVLTVFYSVPPISLQRRGVLSNFTMAIVFVFIPAVTGAVFVYGLVNFSVFFWMAILCLTILFGFCLIMKDFKDIRGDKRHGKKTFVVRVSLKNARWTSVIGTVMFFPLTTYFFSRLFDYQFIFALLSGVIYVFLVYIEIKDTKKYIPIEEDKRFGEVRLTLLCYVILLLIFSIINYYRLIFT